VGVVVALASGRVLRGLLYGVEPVDPTTYAMVVTITMAVGLLAAAVPAVRAARVDPVEALRAE
jgi:ABC-type antimicrobial peptide transport system permease subunit